MTSGRRSREPVLDGVRGIAVLLVLFHHFVIFSGFPGGNRLDGYIDVLGNAAWLGVDLFFVLSGFLITGILFSTKSDPAYFRSFYARRTLRIFPLYYGVLAAVFIVGPLVLERPLFSADRSHQVWFWAYLSNVDVALNGWVEPLELGHVWSLAVEEQFYLLWPLVVYGAGRRRLLQLTAVAFATAFILRVGAVWQGQALAAYVLMPMRMDALAAGAFLSLLIRGPAGWTIVGRWPARVFIVSLASLAGILYWRQGLMIEDPVVATAGFSLIAACAASLIALLVVSPEGSRRRYAFSHPLLTTLGTYSYGLYVFHHIVVIVLRDRGFQVDLFPQLMGSQIPGLLVFSMVAMTLSCLLSYVSWHAWEMPFLRLKRYFDYGDAPSVVRRSDPDPLPGPMGDVGTPGTPTR